MNSSRKSATVRIGNIGGMPDVYRRLDLDFAAALRRAGLRHDVFEDQESLIPFTAVDVLYSIPVEEAGCDHFGLLVGSGPLNLGLPGFLAMQAPTTRIGIQTLVASLNFVDSGSIAQLVERGDVAVASHTIVVPGLRSKSQMGDKFEGILMNSGKGGEWSSTPIARPREME